jgi:uncharacterized protein YkwD
VRSKILLFGLLILLIISACDIPSNLPSLWDFAWTVTPYHTDTPTHTAPFPVTPTASPTFTSTVPPTGTATSTTTSTMSPTNTPTGTLSPTFTFTPTLTSTRTYTPSWTPTSTNTLLPSSTFTPTKTPTLTFTKTTTFTPSSTFTDTPVQPVCVLIYNGTFEAQLLTLINQERTKAGLLPLTNSYPLEISSGLHSADQAQHDFLSHTGSDGSTYWEREVRAGYTGRWGGEIIYAGSGAYNNPESAVKWWMNDPPHKAIILADYQDFGAGYAYCPSDTYGAFFTVDFGHR